MRRLISIVALAVVAAACSPAPGTDTTAHTTARASTTSAVPAPGSGSLVACDTIPRITAPDDWYRDTPVYVGNEMPVEAVAAWAETQPGFQSIWVDRDHSGWITVAFTSDAVDRQRDLLDEFPGVGVVAVEVDWSIDALRRIQDNATAALRGLLSSFSTSTLETQGVVEIGVGRITDDQRQTIADLFTDQPVCLSEPDVTTLPEPGPQPPEGPGWQLLAAEKGIGRTYHTAIATDDPGLAAMWAAIGLEAPVPAVDFQTHVVIWFGAVFGSGCDNLRLDDVVVDGSTIHADANQFAFVVAIERTKLPVGPFAIQLDADGPPGGVPEERTVVDADLSVPGAVARPDQISQGGGVPNRNFIESGDIIEPGFPAQYRMFVHCGINWLGEINSVLWFTPEEMPAEWTGLVTDETLVVSVTVTTGPPPRLRAVANGVAVIYEPTTELPSPCD
jgi:hypothetical protein